MLSRLAGSVISSVNWIEVGSKVAERGASLDEFIEAMRTSPLEIAAFDRPQAEAAAKLMIR
ncbi:MAG TPA: hypothetical protein VE567_02275 [Sphingomonas sp.]|nr:hypothetical protein [Sphingomonas sp.]